ncbi:Uncharacterised protein [Porphyromonas macacae]|uniref:Uncharacterized protein n=1 Tax=Porphyromonas macacae TaxID=28115 RepID=A0A379E903_9PORP|nr:Uncharacterised protein [Porphyromonas macacae]
MTENAINNFTFNCTRLELKLLRNLLTVMVDILSIVPDWN